MNTNLFEDLAGIPVPGNLEGHPPDTEAEARRIPVCIIIDTSDAMRPYADLLLEAVVKLIEQLAENPIAKARIDLQIMTFNTKEQVKIRIPFQELELLVDDNNKLLNSYGAQLVFECFGEALVGYALVVVAASLRRRYNLLKNAGKCPFSPMLFFVSDGKARVDPTEEEIHEAVLESVLNDISMQVSEDRLSCIAVEVGDICKMKDNPENRDEYEKCHKLMRDITGRDDESNIIQSYDIDTFCRSIGDFFTLTES